MEQKGIRCLELINRILNPWTVALHWLTQCFSQLNMGVLGQEICCFFPPFFLAGRALFKQGLKPFDSLTEHYSGYPPFMLGRNRILILWRHPREEGQTQFSGYLTLCSAGTVQRERERERGGGGFWLDRRRQSKESVMSTNLGRDGPMEFSKKAWQQWEKKN